MSGGRPLQHLITPFLLILQLCHGQKPLGLEGRWSWDTPAPQPYLQERFGFDAIANGRQSLGAPLMARYGYDAIANTPTYPADEGIQERMSGCE